MHSFVALSALVAIAWAEPVNAQQVKAGVLTCDVSEGMGYIIGSQKLLSCSFGPEGAGRREDYDGSITKFGLDLGLTRGGFMGVVCVHEHSCRSRFPRWRVRGG